MGENNYIVDLSQMTPEKFLEIKNALEQSCNRYYKAPKEAPEISGDSGEYEFLTEAVELSKDVEGMCCEIGTRRGLSLKHIIDAVLEYCPDKSVISIDPYGSILYQGREGQICRLDYTNQMKYECMAAIYAYLCEHPVDFHFFDIEDTIFFEERQHGVYKYDLERSLMDKYSMVFFDGPHYIEAIIKEIDFLFPRTPSGGTWIFDDITPDFYDHQMIRDYIGYEFNIVRTGLKKEIWQKK